MPVREMTEKEEAVKFFLANQNDPFVDDQERFAELLADCEQQAVLKGWTLHREGIFAGFTVEIMDRDDSGPYPKVKVRYLCSPGTPWEWTARDAVAHLGVILRDATDLIIGMCPLTDDTETWVRVAYAKMAQNALES